MRPFIRLNYAVNIIETYTQNEPLSVHLNRFFKTHKKMGSKDRRVLRAFVYHYFRLGGAQNHFSIKKGLVLGHFLCSCRMDELIEYWLPKETPFHPDQIKKPVPEKFKLLQNYYPDISATHVFPFYEWLTNEIPFYPFLYSLFEQPLVYCYHYNNQPKYLEKALKENQIPFSQKSVNGFGVPPETPLAKLAPYQANEIVIQDLSVQQIFSGINFKKAQTWWDCCAGSGGKSILLKYFEPKVSLWVSDKRKTILNNLIKRFHQLGINHFSSKNWDLARYEPHFLPDPVDGIILDAPCSGSGTWLRTPENLVNTTKRDIEKYLAKQMAIARNATKALNPKGKLVYITCSVFQQENEDMVTWIKQNLGLTCLEQNYFEGYHHKAETLFRAVFEKP